MPELRVGERRCYTILTNVSLSQLAKCLMPARMQGPQRQGAEHRVVGGRHAAGKRGHGWRGLRVGARGLPPRVRERHQGGYDIGFPRTLVPGHRMHEMICV